MTNILSWILIAVIFAIPLILYKKLYFKRVTMICISSDGSASAVSLKPYKRHLSELLGDDVSVCHVRSGYVLFYNRTDLTKAIQYHDHVTFPSCVVLASVRRGRYTSVVVSERVLSDILNSFSFHGGN